MPKSAVPTHRRPRTRTPAARRPLAALLALAMAALGFAVAGSAASAATADTTATAATTPGCDHADAGTGRLARGICWLDLSSYRPAQATSNAGQPMSLTLPDGSTIAFTLKVTGGAVRAAAMPTSPAAFFGNTRYTGIAGSPALYQRPSGTTTTATLSGISVTAANGDPVTRYAVAAADAESTDAGESITWTSDQNLSSLTQTATGKGLGNACGGGLTGLGSTSVTCSAVNSSDSKTGAAIIAADHPSTVAAQLVGGGQEAVAFGVLISRVQLSTTIVNEYPGDDFRVDLTDPDGNNVGSAVTAGTAAAQTPRVTVLTGVAPQTFTLSQAATSGTLASYQDSWSCTRNGLADDTLPSGDAGGSAVVSVGVGDLVSCSITNTAIPASLTLTSQAGTPIDVNGDGLTDAGDTIGYTFTVTNTGSLPIDNILVRDVQAGSVTCLAASLDPGDGTTCAADNPYVVTAADVTAGSAHNRATASGNPSGESANVSSAEATTDTPTTTPAPAVTLVKTATIHDVDGDFQIDLGDTISWSFRVTNSGNVPVSSVAVSDSLAGAVTCPVTTLAPGAQTLCGADAAYTIVQADVDAGFVANTATASATDPDGGAVAAAPASTFTPVNHRSGLAATERGVVTDVNADGHTDLGDTIAYSTIVRNVGTVTLHSITVTDPLTGPVTCPTGSLAPGGQVTCIAAAAYSVSAGDVAAGQVTNTAVAHALDPSGVNVDSAAATARTPVG